MAVALDFERVDDLLQGYFDALRAYNRAIGAYEMTATELAEARAREVALYARVQRFKDALRERSISV